MNEYRPDNWVVLRIMGDTPHYKILAGWSGGYITGDSWRINSGITAVDDVENAFMFKGSTGSVYTCGKTGYGLRLNNAHIWTDLKALHGDKVELMPEDTDWLNMDWIIK